MTTCTKAKNPCKICLQTVTRKNGLQCQGACQTWVHYTCLNYTPGKIKDIQAGIIKVTCPCPDCKSKMPKEYRTDEPFSCINDKCPANLPPVCANSTCPSNVPPPKPPKSPKQPKPPKGPIPCGDSCKNNSKSSVIVVQKEKCPSPKKRKSEESLTSSDSNVTNDNCESKLPLETVEHMCDTVGQLTSQINELMDTLKGCIKDCKENAAKKKDKKKPKKKIEPKHEPCFETGPKALCPKPCFCPGNPGQV